MNEWVVISGKGGTGKTSLTASFAALAKDMVLADCDVDAADLHLILQPDIRRKEVFRSGHEAVIRREACIGCGRCAALCRFGAVRETDADDRRTFEIDPLSCEGCGLCVWNCPTKAIDFPERECGEWYVSDTRHGPMVHARLAPGGENSGKLVSLVREQARQTAKEQNQSGVLVDGPPGTGCAVIAAVTGAHSVLVVTEPTVSGAHDLRRILELTRHFRIPTCVCVNKWDLHPEQAEQIEADARDAGARPVGRVSYSREFSAAQRQRKALTETDSPLAAEVRAVWENWQAAGRSQTEKKP